MGNTTQTQYTYFDVCFDVNNYSLEKDFDDQYLGYDNYMEVDATASLTAVFPNSAAIDSFYTEWEEGTQRGKEPFILKIDYFGSIANYGVLQESPLSMTKNPGYTISFNVRIIFDDDEISNQRPSCSALTVYVPENSRDNYIRVKASDAENNPIKYNMQVPTAYGQLRGSPPAFMYTPDPGYEGTDCFSYNTSDFFGESEPCVVEIVVDTEQMPDHRVRYTTTDLIGASGNFFYSFDDVNYKRGFGGMITPYTTEFEITRNGSFLTDPETGSTAWNLTGDSEIIDESVVFNKNDFVVTGVAQATQDASFIPGESYRVEVIIGSIQTHIGSGVRVEINSATGSDSTPYITTSGSSVHTVIAGTGAAGDSIAITTDGSPAVIDRVRIWKSQDTSTVWIRSNDHKLDPTYPNITQCLIRDWGSRVDFSEYLIGQNNLNADDGFSICEMAGHCEGEDFTSMFEDTSVIEMPVLLIDKMITSDRMFYNAKVQRLKFDPASAGIQHYWKSAKRMFTHSDITNVFDMQTYWVQDFTEMFYDTPLICLEYLNTATRSDRPIVVKSRLFDNTPSLVKPTAAQVTDLTDSNGMSFSNGGGCGIIITNIEATSGMASCTIPTYGGTCTSTTRYEVSYVNETTPLTFNWSNTKGSVTSGGGSGDDFIEISIASEVEISFSITCTITDSSPGTVSSGAYNFTHSRTKGYEYYTLPKKYERIDLNAFIADKSPASNEIVVYNDKINCSIYASGFPSSWNVTLINDGEFQGLAKGNTNTNYTSNHGLYVTTNGEMRLVNNGVIRGAGGYGGTGGKGDNSSYSTNETSAVRYGSNDFWDVYPESIHCRFYGTYKTSPQSNPASYTGPVYHGPDGYKMYRYAYKTTVNGNKRYSLYGKRTISKSYTGGAGGTGGHGAGYNHSADYSDSWRVGASGKSSSPTGGYSGATGGTGGWWGNDGYVGKSGSHTANGAAGKDGCPAIHGESRLSGDSKIGSVSGAIV